MNPYCSLLLTLCVCLFPFMGCGSMDENPPAQLISTVPAEGETIDTHGLIYFCFDKAVTDVRLKVATGFRVNHYSARNRHGKPSAAAWEIESNTLDIWPRGFGFHPGASVQIDITFEHDAERYHETLNVRTPDLYVNGEPLVILGDNVSHRPKGVDSELLNTVGIQIIFNDNLQGGTAVLRPKDGAPLNWIADWKRDSLRLYPRNGDRLQNGTEYIIELIVNDGFGEYDFEIRFTTKE